MKCPECQTKLTTKHYDAEFEWYECPNCEGCFTSDELEEANGGSSVASRRQTEKPVAKGKARQSAIQEDADAIAEFEAANFKVTKKADEAPKVKVGVSSGQVRQIMGDEIELIAEETGTTLNRINAVEFFAFNLVLALLRNKVPIREGKVPMVKCPEHV